MTPGASALALAGPSLSDLIRARTVDEVLAANEGRPRFVVEGLIHASTTLVYGMSEAGKSWLMADLVAALARTPDWLGQPIHGRPRRCLILASDTGGVAEYAERLGPGYGDAVVLATPPPVNLDTWAALAEVSATEEVGLVIVDNMYAWAGAVDVNSNAEVAKPLACLRALARVGIAVVLVHHANSGGGKPAGVHAIQAFFRHSLSVTRDRVRAHGNDTATATYPLRRQGGRVLGLGHSIKPKTAATEQGPLGVAPVKSTRTDTADRHRRARAELEKRPDLTSIRARGTHLSQVMDDVATPEAGTRHRQGADPEGAPAEVAVDKRARLLRDSAPERFHGKARRPQGGKWRSRFAASAPRPSPRVGGFPPITPLPHPPPRPALQGGPPDRSSPTDGRPSRRPTGTDTG